jgi:adenosylmethionine-8-amino-7-oxononanoate aminotransferase
VNAVTAPSPINQSPVKRVGPNLTVTPRIVKAALARSLITHGFSASYTISISPPFITAVEIDDMVARARAAIDASANKLVRDQG